MASRRRVTVAEATEVAEGDDNSVNLGFFETRELLFLVGLVLFSLAVGALGYYYTTKLSLVDSFYNASLILAGMGPANTLECTGGKFFASFYALYSGLVFIVIIAFFIQEIIEGQS
jgi:hypothetical protein